MAMEATHASKRTRLMVDISPDLRRRIKTAAAQEDLSVRAYVERILEDSVPALQRENRQPMRQQTVRRLLQTREKVMHGRRFDDDSTDLLHEARDERLSQLP